MKRPNPQVRVWLSITILLWCLPAWAADNCNEAERLTSPSFETLQDLVSDECLGGKNDADDLTTQVKEALDNVPLAVGFDARRSAVRSQLLFIATTLSQRRDEVNLSGAVERNPLNVIVNEILLTAREFDQNTDTVRLTDTYWEFDVDEGIIGDGLYHLNTELFQPSCAPALPETSCQAAFAVAKEAVRSTTLMRRVGDYWGRPGLAAFSRELSIADAQWKQYATEARSQFLWELAFNSWVYASHEQPPTLLREPPNQQFILVHPTVAMEYVDNADEGSRFKPALMMEWIGINTWRWGKRDRVKMERPLGVALVSTFSDRAGTDNAGHGVVFHFKHQYSIGVTSRGGDTGVFLSVDLQRLLMDENTQMSKVRSRFDLN